MRNSQQLLISIFRTFIYFMEQPQEFLAKEITSDEYKPRTDRIEKDIIQPVSFENPKIRVGRDKIKTNKNV